MRGGYVLADFTLFNPDYSQIIKPMAVKYNKRLTAKRRKPGFPIKIVRVMCRTSTLAACAELPRCHIRETLNTDISPEGCSRRVSNFKFAVFGTF